MIVNPVMYGAGSAEVKTITITTTSTNSVKFYYYDENYTLQTKTVSKNSPVDITARVGTTVVSVISALSGDGLSEYTMVSGTIQNLLFHYIL